MAAVGPNTCHSLPYTLKTRTEDWRIYSKLWIQTDPRGVVLHVGSWLTALPWVPRAFLGSQRFSQPELPPLEVGEVRDSDAISSFRTPLPKLQSFLLEISSRNISFKM